MSDLNTTLKERVEWALKKPDSIVKKEGITKGQQEEKLKNEEKKWGNRSCLHILDGIIFKGYKRGANRRNN